MTFKGGARPVGLRFVGALAGDLGPRRRALVDSIFDRIVGAGGGGAASLADVGACFRADRHPDVERGASTAARVLADFLEALRESGSLDHGRLTRSGLVAFYRLSAAFVPDEEFDLDRMVNALETGIQSLVQTTTTMEDKLRELEDGYRMMNVVR